MSTPNTFKCRKDGPPVCGWLQEDPIQRELKAKTHSAALEEMHVNKCAALWIFTRMKHRSE